MAFCAKCGAALGEGEKFCPQCGEAAVKAEPAVKTAAEVKVEAATDAAVKKFDQLNNTADTTAAFGKDDIEKNKGITVLAYLGILLLIPLFSAKDSKFARFHCNQGIILCIVAILYSVVVSVLISIVTAISWRLGLTVSSILSIVGLVFLAWVVIGIINVCNGRAKELPVIGKFKILK